MVGVDKLMNRKGFTIVELLIVIVVIGILAAITIIAYNGIQTRARDAKRTADISSIQKAVELYKADNGFYPQPGNDDAGYDLSALAPFLVSKYIASIPSDPKAGVGYGYVRSAVAYDAYGILINYEARAVCKRGVNVAAGWWGSGVPTCT